VIVIGGGPSGATAAFVLAKAGMSVLLLDAAVFPRDKLCGGLLSRRAEKTYKAVFEKPWDPAIEFASHGAVFFDGHSKIQSVEHVWPTYFTSRTKFDAHLLAQAAAAGVVVQEQRRALHVYAPDSRVQAAGGPDIQADFIIGCEGVNSPTARGVGLPPLSRRRLAAGLEVHIPRDLFSRQPDKPEIYFRLAEWGYAWLFPKRDCVTVGMAGLVQKNRNLKGNFTRFLSGLNGGRLPEVRWKGHPIPFGNYRARPGKANILLAGDAAGLVEPVTGEGIAFAMESGRYAAQAILAAAAAGRPDSALSRYLESYSRITALFRQARIMRHLVFQRLTQPIFLRVLARSQTVATRYLDLLAAEIGYGEYARFLAKVLIRRFLV